MAEHGKVFVPFDFRGLQKNKPPFLVSLDEDAEERGVEINIFDSRMHIQMKLDERGLGSLIDSLTKARLEIVSRTAYQRGAANALRRKR